MNWAYVALACIMSAFVILLRQQLFHIFVGRTEAVALGCRMLLIISPFYITNIYIENSTREKGK